MDIIHTRTHTHAPHTHTHIHTYTHTYTHTHTHTHSVSKIVGQTLRAYSTHCKEKSHKIKLSISIK